MSSRADDRPRRDRSRSRSRDRAHRDDRRALSRERDSGRYETRGPRVEREEGEYRSPRRSRSPARRRSASPRRSRSPSRHRRRSRSRSRSLSYDRHKSRRKDRKRSRSRSRSVSSSSSSSSDERRQKRKHKHHKRKRSRSKDREKKQRKKEKKERKKKTAAVGHQWGKYGIISEADLYHKEAEFRAWLVEEQKINPETISKDRTKKEFARFVEDFNTATLPHEKFYNIASYEARMTALRAGEYLPPQDDGYDPNADLRALQSSHKRKAKESDSFITREQLEELRKVQAERVEVGKMKLLGMDIKQSMGVRMDGTAFDD